MTLRDFLNKMNSGQEIEAGPEYHLFMPIHIGKNVWLGANARKLREVTVS